MGRDYYVYCHRDRAGNVFYVGKGVERRAWSRDRHGLWHKYVQEYLGGHYTVEIVEEGLSENEALSLEARMIRQYREQLVNWFTEGSITCTISIGVDPVTGSAVVSADERGGPDRQQLYDDIDRYQRLRQETRRLNAEARSLQSTDPECALTLVRLALDHVRDYSLIQIPHDVAFVESLMERERAGDVDVIHRLVQILKQLGRHREIVEEVDRYLDDFPGDLRIKRMAPVVRNRNKAARHLGLGEIDPYHAQAYSSS